MKTASPRMSGEILMKDLVFVSFLVAHITEGKRGDQCLSTLARLTAAAEAVAAAVITHEAVEAAKENYSHEHRK